MTDEEIQEFIHRPPLTTYEAQINALADAALQARADIASHKRVGADLIRDLATARALLEDIEQDGHDGWLNPFMLTRITAFLHPPQDGA